MITLGIDSGTQSTKAIAVEIETGEVLATAQATYGMVEGLPPGHLEQEPAWWLAALEETIGRVAATLGQRVAEVAAIGVSGQQHGLVALDKDGIPVRPAKLWCDTSTVEQCRQFEQEFGGASGLVELTGNAILPGYTAPKILWLKQNEPDNFEKIHSILLPHDYLNYHLTGVASMEYGDASGTGLMDVRSRTWLRELVDFIDLRTADWLPPLRPSMEPCGTLKPKLAGQWGMPASVIVSAGGGDNMMGAIGTGNLSSGCVTASLGTSGTLYAYSESPIVDTKGEVAGFCDSTGGWLPLVCTMNVTVVTEAVRSLFNWPIADLESAVSSVPAGADGLIFLPYLNGERTPNLPDARGSLHGLNPHNFRPAHMARAAMEGATLGLGYGLKRLRELGVEPTEIRLTGGGSKSATWRQLVADVFGVPSVCLRVSEGAAFGAALQAAWQAGGTPASRQPLIETAARLVCLDEQSRCQPNAESATIYRQIAEKFEAMTAALR